MKKNALIILLAVINTALQGQPSIKFENFSESQIQSQSAITCILQDQQGMIWYGTENGLTRYDGYTFVAYQHDPTDSNSLSSSQINALCQDREGIFWIGTRNGGLNKYDPVRNRFTRYQQQPDNPRSLSSNQVYSVCEDHQGAIWVGTYSGLNRLDKITGQFTRYKSQPGDSTSLSADRIPRVYEDRLGMLWIGTAGGGLNRFDRTTGKFIRYGSQTGDPYSLPSKLVYSIYEDKSGQLWFGSFAGTVYQLDRKTNRFVGHRSGVENGTLSVDNGLVMSICEDRLGNLWLGTFGHGLYGFNQASGKFTRYQQELDNPDGLNNNSIFSLYTDRTGAIWVGTLGSGLSKFFPAISPIIQYQNQANDKNSISSNFVLSVLQGNDGALWVGTVSEGLNRIDRATGQITRYRSQLGDPYSLTSNTVFGIYQDRSGMLWVSSGGVGLSQLNPTTGKCVRYQKQEGNPGSLADNAVKAVYEDRSGNLWVGGGSGLSRFDRATQTFIFYPSPKDTLGRPYQINRSILEDQTGVFLIGTTTGLLIFNPKTHAFTPYTGVSAALTGTINDLYESHSGTVWIAAEKGLYAVNNRKDTHAVRYGKKDGFPADEILTILEDDRGQLWINTVEGMARFNPATKVLKNYNTTVGLMGMQVSGNVYAKSKTGEIIAGMSNGVVIFHPDSLRDNPYIPPIVLTDFQIFNQSVPVQTSGDRQADQFRLTKSILATDEITLPYRANVFSFEFAALDYTRPKKNQYAYRMEGFDKDWNYVGNQRSATYTNLESGSYTFRVKGSNSDGVWNETGRSVLLTILPPWWRTGWAYLLYSLVTLGLLYSSWRYTANRERLHADLRFQRLEAQNQRVTAQKLQEIDQLKTRFFTNISHEFRTPLTLILGPLEEWMADQQMPETNGPKLRLMHRNARRLLELINQLLDLSRLEARQLQLQAQPGDLVFCLKVIVASFETLAQQRQVSLQFSSTSSTIPLFFDQDKLEKIMYNLISNAFKFTPSGGVISVRAILDKATSRTHPVEEAAGYAVVVVEDSGNGIPADQLDRIFDRFYQVNSSTTREQEGSGIGLALTRELVLLHGGEITVSSQPGEGTQFTIRLPMGRDHLKDGQIAEAAVVAGHSLFRATVPIETVSEAPLTEVSVGSSQELPLVLIVEDNDDMRTHVRNSLGTTFQIVEARDGEAGFQQATERIPDLVISDVMMPKLDGYQLSERLKTDQRTSHIPVILLTAWAGLENKLEGLETGADDYLVKPFDAEELRLRVSNLIKQRRQLRARFKSEITLKPSDITITSTDERFLRRAIEIVEANLGNEAFTVDTFSREIALSQSQLYRKLTALTGHNPSEFVRRLRLQRAADLLAAGKGNVTEVSYEVGFNNLSYFSKCFRELHGQSPSEYVASHAKVE